MLLRPQRAPCRVHLPVLCLAPQPTHKVHQTILRSTALNLNSVAQHRQLAQVTLLQLNLLVLVNNTLSSTTINHSSPDISSQHLVLGSHNMVSQWLPLQALQSNNSNKSNNNSNNRSLLLQPQLREMIWLQGIDDGVQFAASFGLSLWSSLLLQLQIMPEAKI